MAVTGRDGLAAGVRRFARVPRWVHWTTAAIMFVCLGSAAVLYYGPLAEAVGRRQLVETVHLYAGYALPVPVVVGWLSRTFRQDVSALNRFGPQDGAWLRARFAALWTRRRQRAAGRPADSADARDLGVGKFNAGQKLYASFAAGTIVVMLGTGLLMEFGPGFDLRLSWRTGATFVHDWLAFFAAVAIVGHLWMAWRDPVARTGMRTGVVPLWWARRHHPAWAESQAPAPEPAPATAPSTQDPRTPPASAGQPAAARRAANAEPPTDLTATHHHPPA